VNLKISKSRKKELLRQAPEIVQEQWRLLHESTKSAIAANKAFHAYRADCDYETTELVEHMLMEHGDNIPWALIRWKQHDSLDALFDHLAQDWGQYEPWPDFYRWVNLRNLPAARQCFDDLRVFLEAQNRFDKVLGALNALT
jgi:hypothetical protein